MLRFIVYTCSLHICDMFDEMNVMDSRVPIKVVFKYLHFHYCFIVIFIFLKVSFNSRQ